MFRHKKLKICFILFCSGLVLFIILSEKFRNHFNSNQTQDYYKKLQKPVIKKGQVLQKMEINKGLFKDDKELIEAVKWYVFNNRDKEIIMQLINNLEYETKVTFKFSDNSSYMNLKISGVSYDILSQGILSSVISPVLHKKLYDLSNERREREGLLYLVMKLIEINEPKIDEKVIPYLGTVDIHDNISWYTTKTVLNDIYAYLKIYAKYDHNHKIQLMSFDRITSVYELWLDHIDQSFALRLAEEKGVENAFKFIEPCIRPGSFKSNKEAIIKISAPETIADPNLPFLCCHQSEIAGCWQPLKYKFDPFLCELVRKDKPWLQGSYCPKCMSLRILNYNNFTERIMLSHMHDSESCDHLWAPGVHAWSLEFLSVGDFLIVIYKRDIFVIRINSIHTDKIEYSIAMISLNNCSNDVLDLNIIEWKHVNNSDHLEINNRIIPIRVVETSDDSKRKALSIWYDYYYGGFPEKSSFEDAHLLMAIVHKPDLQESRKIDLEHLRFKTWEDGLGNHCEVLGSL